MVVRVASGGCRRQSFGEAWNCQRRSRWVVRGGLRAIEQIVRAEEMIRIIRTRPAEGHSGKVLVRRQGGAGHRRAMGVAIHKIAFESINAPLTKKCRYTKDGRPGPPEH